MAQPSVPPKVHRSHNRRVLSGPAAASICSPQEQVGNLTLSRIIRKSVAQRWSRPAGIADNNAAGSLDVGRSSERGEEDLSIVPFRPEEVPAAPTGTGDSQLNYTLERRRIVAQLRLRLAKTTGSSRRKITSHDATIC